MFIKQNNLIFINSANIKAFPCGRRRSLIVDQDGSPATVSDRYYIPFDPESRLNTEANNRKHSGLNGFTQTYVKSWDEASRTVLLSLAGYSFDIALDEDYASCATFGEAVAALLGGAPDEIYANIRMEETPLVAELASTVILRDQTSENTALTCLDVPSDTKTETDDTIFYFSGLSFSAQPISASKNSQQVAHICILKYTDGAWMLNQAALLPEIKHGATVDSVEVTSLEASHVSINSRPVMSLSIEDGQLVFSST